MTGDSSGADGPRRQVADRSAIALFVTCVVDLVRPEVAVATVGLLRRAGAEVSCPTGQTCCGQPAWNAGFTEEAAAVAGATLAALEADPAPVIVVPAGSCATMIRRYWPQLFALAGRPDDAERATDVGRRVRELSEWLAAAAAPDAPAPAPASGDGSPTVALHRSCHLERELHVVDQPAALLARTTGQEPAQWPGDDRCCGFGGTFSVRLPEVSVAMADDKLDLLPDGVATVVGCDTSCLLHLEARARERGLTLRFRHLAEVLADRAAAAPTEPRRRPDPLDPGRPPDPDG